MIVDTRRLFLRLLRTFEIETVCDVGSMDGYDALLFRRALPAAEVIALEPNPRNFALMQADERLRRQRVRILPLAASDCESEAPFFVVAAEYAVNRDLQRRGTGSMYRPRLPVAEVAQVQTARLDNLLAAHGRDGGRIALWIDTEGMAFETISGASGTLGRTQMLHVEVETVPCIGASQKLLSDVERLLIETGFVLLATDQARAALQLNALFVRADLREAKAREIDWHVATARLHRDVKRAVRSFLPRRFRHFFARRANAVRVR